MKHYNVHLMKAMTAKGYSFRTLAAKVGIQSATLRSYARRDSSPVVELGVEIAEELEVPAKWLWVEEPSHFELEEAPRLAEMIRRASVKGD